MNLKSNAYQWWKVIKMWTCMTLTPTNIFCLGQPLCQVWNMLHILRSKSFWVLYLYQLFVLILFDDRITLGPLDNLYRLICSEIDLGLLCFYGSVVVDIYSHIFRIWVLNCFVFRFGLHVKAIYIATMPLKWNERKNSWLVVTGCIIAHPPLKPLP